MSQWHLYIKAYAQSSIHVGLNKIYKYWPKIFVIKCVIVMSVSLIN